jgi:hypothetical protein
MPKLHSIKYIINLCCLFVPTAGEKLVDLQLRRLALSCTEGKRDAENPILLTTTVYLKVLILIHFR